MLLNQLKARRDRGFTLIELMIVIAIIVILAATIIGLLINGRRRAENERCRAAMVILASALDRYKDTHGNFPKLDTTSDPAVLNNRLLQELMKRVEVEMQGGLKRKTPAALSDIQDIKEFLGDSDGDWDPEQPFLDANDILVEGVEIVDPWGQPFLYRAPGERHDGLEGSTDNRSTYDLWSIGRNGEDESDATDLEETDDWTNWYRKDQASD